MCSYCYDVVDYIKHFFGPPADWEILEICWTIHFYYFRYSESSNYCWCFAWNETVWLREGQNQTNRSYNFNSENVYKYLQKDKVIPSFVHDIWKSAQGSIRLDVMKLAENVYIVTTHTHTHKAGTNTHRYSSTHTHTHLHTRTYTYIYTHTHTQTHSHKRTHHFGWKKKYIVQWVCESVINGLCYWCMM